MYLGNLSESTARLYAAGAVFIFTLLFFVLYSNRQKLTKLDKKLGASAFRGKIFVKYFRYLCLGFITIFFIYSVYKANSNFWDGIPFYLIILPSIILMYAGTLVKWENYIRTNRDFVVIILITTVIAFQLISYIP